MQLIKSYLVDLVKIYKLRIMKREIKFKIRNKDTGKKYNDGWYEDLYQSGGVIEFPSMDGDVVCQFTGLTDKNGVEIYEGDVIKYHFNKRYSELEMDYINTDEYFVAEVKYKPCSFYLQGVEDYTPHLINTCIDTLEVIGNIHETPELLN